MAPANAQNSLEGSLIRYSASTTPYPSHCDVVQRVFEKKPFANPGDSRSPTRSSRLLIDGKRSPVQDGRMKASPRVSESRTRLHPRLQGFLGMTCITVLLLLISVGSVAAFAAEPLPVSTPTPASTAERLPGVELAEGVSQLTGVAISPLLGVSAVGAWKYYETPEARRGRLPWFCHPGVWGAGLFLAGLCFLKDLFGTAAPPLLKKPFDVIELFENKLSAVVACSAFLPYIVSQMARYAPEQAAIAVSSDPMLASIVPVAGFDVRYITIPLAIFGFLIVWLATHAINVMIVLCPFGFIDGLLKLLKGFLLSSVVASSFISPFLGAVVSLAILFVAALIAPWAFRLMVFGAVFGLDVLWPHRGQRLLRPAAPHGFLAVRIAHAPRRTYGRLTRAADGSVKFAYRPWLLFPERSVTLPTGKVAIVKGVLYPSLLHGEATDQQRERIVVMFLPRYRSHEHVIASHFEIANVQASPLLKGFQAAREWFREIIKPEKTRSPELPQTS